MQSSCWNYMAQDTQLNRLQTWSLVKTKVSKIGIACEHLAAHFFENTFPSMMISSLPVAKMAPNLCNDGHHQSQYRTILGIAKTSLYNRTLEMTPASYRRCPCTPLRTHHSPQQLLRSCSATRKLSKKLPLQMRAGRTWLGRR